MQAELLSCKSVQGRLHLIARFARIFAGEVFGTVLLAPYGEQTRVGSHLINTDVKGQGSPMHQNVQASVRLFSTRGCKGQEVGLNYRVRLVKGVR